MIFGHTHSLDVRWTIATEMEYPVNFYYSSSLNGLNFNFDLSFSFHFSLVPVSFQNRSVCFSSVFIQKKRDQKQDLIQIRCDNTNNTLVY